MPLSPKIAITDDFLRSFARIPRDRQQAVLKFVVRFRSDPAASTINYEKIRRAADPNMRSVRIDENYRSVVLKPSRGDVYCLLWVDKHDDAYTWASRHKVEIHPEVGGIQILRTEYQSESTSVDNPPTPDERTGLFHTLRDREIIRLGVPEQYLRDVRGVQTEDGLYQLEDRLPDDAYEALFMYAAGESYDVLVAERETSDEVDTDDFASALERDQTRRHFAVITEDSDLEAILAAPLETWRVFLHPSQRSLVERTWNGPVRVLGGAGTGKTVAAMHRAAWLARGLAGAAGKHILFTTFTRTLSDDIRDQLSSICSPSEMDRIAVVNIDQWAVGVLRRYRYPQEILYNEEQRAEFWNRAIAHRPEASELPDTFYRAEFERVILPQGCQTIDDYARANRLGRGVQLNRRMRRAIWPVFAEYRAQLSRENYKEPDEAFADARMLIEQHGDSFGIRHIIIDEAQDLSAAALRLLRAVVPHGCDDMFIVGDAHQRIYRHKVVLSREGIEIRGRSRKLRINYRTTDEIRRWAVAQLDGCDIDDLDGQSDHLRHYQSLTHGPIPTVWEGGSTEEEFPRILSYIEELMAEGIEESSICVVCRTNKEADAHHQWLESVGMKALRLTRTMGDDRKQRGIRVASMHRVKGLEFDAVIIAGYRGPEFEASRTAEDADAGVMLDSLTSERCLLHVAATRAKRFLAISRVSPQCGGGDATQ